MIPPHQLPEHAHERPMAPVHQQGRQIIRCKQPQTLLNGTLRERLIFFPGTRVPKTQMDQFNPLLFRDGTEWLRRLFGGEGNDRFQVQPGDIFKLLVEFHLTLLWGEGLLFFFLTFSRMAGSRGRQRSNGRWDMGRHQ